MHDEFRARSPGRASPRRPTSRRPSKTEAELHTEFRPRAEKRVKTLLVLSKIAEAEGVEVADADVEAEVAAARERYADDPRTLAYFDSERGRNFIREHAAPDPDRGEPGRSLAHRPPGPSGAAPPRGRRRGRRGRRHGRSGGGDRRDDPSVRPRRRARPGHDDAAEAVAPGAADVEPTPSPVADRA